MHPGGIRSLLLIIKSSIGRVLGSGSQSEFGFAFDNQAQRAFGGVPKSTRFRVRVQLGSELGLGLGLGLRRCAKTALASVGGSTVSVTFDTLLGVTCG